MNSTSILCAFLSAVLMGTIGVFSKITGLSAEVITFTRLILGAVFMLVFLLAIRKMRLALYWPSWPVVVSGCFLAGFIIFYVQAMNFTSMANAIMLVYLAPLIASVAAHFFLNERLTLISYGLILLALFGFAMMLEFRVELSRQSSEFIGICLGVLALLCYAGFILVNRIIPQQIHVYTRAFYQLLVGALVMIPFMLPSVNEIRSEHIIWLVGTGFFPGFLAILFAVIALSRLPAATFGTIAYIEPVAVVIFGWTIFNESLSALQLAGCLLIILCGIGKTLLESSGASLPET
ncbi:MAG: DMT family transporter [Desulfobacterales bacterium]|nr:DMT family transporter [Deltaproteobacteria bacterium]NNK92843.1 DMT family transporter [Desulfobacterales bacterium]